MLFGVKPNLCGLPEWGARILVMTQAASKLNTRSEEARWVGYSGTSQGHRVYRLSTHRISVERNVTFEGEVLLPPVVLDVAPIVGEQLVSDNQSNQNTARPENSQVKPNTNKVPAAVIQDFESQNDQTAPRHSERLNCRSRDL